MNSADLDVLAAADRLRQHPVGDVADQHVLERVLALAGEPAARARDDQVLLLERRRGSGRGRGPPRPRSRRARPPRRSARRPRRAGAAGARGGRASRAGRRAGAGRCSGSACGLAVSSSSRRLTISSANSGLPPERSATCGTTSPAPLPAARQQRRDQLARLGLGQRLERDRGRVAPAAAPAGAALEQLVAGQADEQQRRPDPARQVLDQVEHSLVGPVDVLEREHERAAPGDRLDHGADGGEERLAHPLRVRPRTARRSSGGSRPSGIGEQRGVPLARRTRRPSSLISSRRRRERSFSQAASGGVGVDDPELVAEDLAQRPVDDPGAVGRALPAPDRRGLVGLGEAASSARAAAATCPTPAWPITVTRCGRPSRSTRSNSETSSPASSSRPISGVCGAAAAAARLGEHAGRLPGRHRLGLALQRQRLEPLVGDRLAGRAVGRSPTVTLSGRPAACSRAATLTASPITV